MLGTKAIQLLKDTTNPYEPKKKWVPKMISLVQVSQKKLIQMKLERWFKISLGVKLKELEGLKKDKGMKSENDRPQR